MKGSFSLIEQDQLSTEDSLLLDTLEENIRISFNTFVSDLCIENKLDSFSLLLSNANRNTYASKPYSLFSRLLLLENKINNKQYPEKIYVSSKEIYNIATQIVENREIPIVIKKRDPNIYFKVFKNITVSLYFQTIYFILSRLLDMKRIPEGPIIFLDTFIFKDTFSSEGGFIDRYYTGYDDYLTDDEKDSIWYSPTIIDIKNPVDLFNTWKNQKRSKKNFFCEEALLGLSDYLKSFFLSTYLYKSVTFIPRFRDYDVSGYLRSELKKEICSPSLVKAINKYLYIKKLSNKVQIIKAINWHENQDIDRAINLSFKKYLPKLQIYGYQGYVSPRSDLHKTPTEFEFDQGTLPNVIGVLSESDVAYKTNLCPKQEFKIAPALRFSHLHKLSKSMDHSLRENIFVPLPADINDATRLIQFSSNFVSEISNHYQFVIKIHPKYTFEDLSFLIPELNHSSFVITDNSVGDCLKDAFVVFSSGSTACVEAYSLGLPVGILSNSSGLTMNPIWATGDELFSIIYSQQDLKDLLKYASASGKRNIRSDQFFHKVDKEEVRKIFTN